jgi:hypothetical protein
MLEFRGHRQSNAPPLRYVVCMKIAKSAGLQQAFLLLSWRHLEGFAFRARDAASRLAYVR